MGKKPTDKTPTPDFSYSLHKICSDSLELDYFLVPWDSEILGYPVAEIKRIRLSDPRRAENPYQQFMNWSSENDIQFCNCRVQHDQIHESVFLQNHQFRFIELNYRPVLKNLKSRVFPDDRFDVVKADIDDREELVEIAQRIFEFGRFHQDPNLGPELGNKRYGIWMRNSFSHPDQVVYKCMESGNTIAFFVVEYPGNSRCHWSLIGLTPDQIGKGAGYRVWQRMMRFHQAEGMNEITTSISSHNVAVFNLYVKLGFRFPMPKVTYHWSR